MAKMMTRFGAMKPAAGAMTDKSKTMKSPQAGPDFDDAKRNTSTVTSTAPKLPDRDGPAKKKMPMQKPKTSADTGKTVSPATIAAMKKDLGQIGKFKR